MNAKHTPGPWHRDHAPTDVLAAGGKHICDTSIHHIADDLHVDAANARLIAAAPDLLEALQAIIGHDAHMLNPHRVAAARAAIAKAEGGAQ